MSVATALSLIRSGQGDYPVTMFPSAGAVAEAIRAVPDSRLIVDERVAALHPQIVQDVDPARLLRLSATEEEKTFVGVERVSRFLQATQATKSTVLVVIGGGIIQDIGAFTAHLYYRGIPYLLVPTTLLSMGDSCIGAKTGINLGSFKNQLGFFQSPAQVLVWEGFTRTLSPQDVASGFGEILKLAIIGGEETYAWFRDRVLREGFSIERVSDVISLSLRVKQRVIEEDEYERDLRRILNYGHTFGHALEGVTQHEVPHGLAVAWGVDLANYVSWRTGLLSRERFEDIHAFVRLHFGFSPKKPYAAPALLAAMKRDKKASAGTITLVLLAEIGDLRLVPQAADATLEAMIATYIGEYDVFGEKGS